MSVARRAAAAAAANGISGQFSWAESRNRGCIFTVVLIWLETYYDRACNAALGARVIWYICFAYRIARGGAGRGERGSCYRREKWRGGEKESEKVCSNTNVFAFHNKLRTHGATRHRNRRGWYRWYLLVSIRAMRDQLCLFIAKRSVRSHLRLAYEFTLPNVRPFLPPEWNDPRVDIFIFSFKIDHFQFLSFSFLILCILKKV